MAALSRGRVSCHDVLTRLMITGAQGAPTSVFDRVLCTLIQPPRWPPCALLRRGPLESLFLRRETMEDDCLDRDAARCSASYVDRDVSGSICPIAGQPPIELHSAYAITPYQYVHVHVPVCVCVYKYIYSQPATWPSFSILPSEPLATPIHSWPGRCASCPAR